MIYYTFAEPMASTVDVFWRYLVTRSIWIGQVRSTYLCLPTSMSVHLQLVHDRCGFEWVEIFAYLMGQKQRNLPRGVALGPATVEELSGRLPAGHDTIALVSSRASVYLKLSKNGRFFVVLCLFESGAVRTQAVLLLGIPGNQCCAFGKWDYGLVGEAGQ